MVTLFPSTSSMFCLVMKFQARLEPLLSNARPSARPQNVEKSLRTKRGLQSGFTFRIEMIDLFELCTFVSKNHYFLLRRRRPSHFENDHFNSGVSSTVTATTTQTHLVHISKAH